MERADPAENEPVVSDIPTLIFSGAWDPATPPQNAEAVHAHLANSRIMTIGEGGHDPMLVGGKCSMTAMSTFLADPMGPVDTECAAAPIDFSYTLEEWAEAQMQQPVASPPPATPAD